MNNNNSIINVDCSKFLSFNNEQVILAIKKHPITLISNFFIIGFILLFLLSILIVSIYYINELFLLIPGVISITLLGIILIVHSLVSTYYHIYVITTRKFLELRFLPFGQSFINEILLDQVKCTEVDMESDGVIYNIFDVGSVILTFDRPTHQKEYVLSNVKNHRKVGMILSQLIIDNRNKPTVTTEIPKDIWFKSLDNQPLLRYGEEATS